MKACILCTVWIKKDNKYSGTISNDGDILNAGKTLIENYNSAKDIEEIISKGAMYSIEKTPEKTKHYANGTNAYFKNYGYNMMKEASKNYMGGSYIYIFDIDSNEWYFGDKMKLRLKEIVNKAI